MSLTIRSHRGSSIAFGPVVHAIGRILFVIGAGMSLPALLDWWHDDPHWTSFAASGFFTALAGLMMAVATRGAVRALTVQQAFLLTAGLWAVVPLFGALPFMIGAPRAGFVDALFESMSGFTTTGTTVFPGLDNLPRGTNLWRVLTHWAGGLGIVVVAMVFLPVMKVGGMQFFRSEGFDTMGKILPRAGEIAAEMTRLYCGLTAIAAITFIMLGMTGYDAIVHALSACSTGGFSNGDASLGKYLGAPQWAATAFMFLASVPFIRLVQAVRGQFMPFWKDAQIRAYFRWWLYATALISLYRLLYAREDVPAIDVVREALFNTMSVFSGTGFSSVNVLEWGHLPFVVLIICGLIGGCTGSTGCSVKVFRYLVLFQAVKAQLMRVYAPSRVTSLRLQGQKLDRDVIDSVMAFFTLFMLTFGLLIVGLALTGLHPRTALTGAWTAIANVGPVWGPEVSPNGGVDQFPTSAKWMMIFGMYAGRLELISVLVLLLPRFWRS